MRRVSTRRASRSPAQQTLWKDTGAIVRAPQPVLPSLQQLSELRDPAAALQRLRRTDWAFTEGDTGYLGHDLHPYPAKFIPQIPANLIATLSLPGEVVWDPFGGSGTTALEALLLGRRAISTDINPLATLIAQTKTTALSPEQRDDLQSLHARLQLLADAHDIERLLDAAWPRVRHHVPDAPNLDNWFQPEAIRELAYIREEIKTLADEATRRFADVALSSIIISASNQDGETRYARRIKDLKSGAALRMFCAALWDALVKHEPMEHLLGYRRAVVVTLDARQIAKKNADFLPPESVDLIVTSPPYANANDYHLYHRFRLFWMGYDPRMMAKDEIGSHLRHQREKRGFELYLEDLSLAFEGMTSRLRAGRYCVLIVGDSVFDGVTIRTSDAISDTAKRFGLKVIGTISREVHPTRRSFIPTARRTRSEDLVLLRKPPKTLSVLFFPPSYRMWPYERTLRVREMQAALGVRPTSDRENLVAKLDPYQIDRVQRLVFTHTIQASSGTPQWRTWQAVLENGDTNTQRKDPKYLTHGIHPYKGKFYPQLCKALLNLANLAPGSTVLDPFCGSGTVLLEAQLNGHVGVGCDLHPLAVLISRAKTAVATESAVLLDRVTKDFADRISKGKCTESSLEYFRPELRDEIVRWFPCPVSRRLAWLLSMIDHVPNTAARLVLQVLLSSIIREVSQQEPADLRIRRRKTLLKDAPVLELFQTRIAGFRERLQHFGERMSAAPTAFSPTTVVEGDARDWATLERFGRRVDCIVTSPPYATALPYIDTDRLSLLVILGTDSTRRSQLEQGLTGSREIREHERLALEQRISAAALADQLGSHTAATLVRQVYHLNRSTDVGFRRRNMAALLFRYFSDMRRVLENLGRVIAPSGHLFFVIGDNKTTAGRELVPIQSGRVLAEMGSTMGWKLKEQIPITVTKEALLHAHHSITENVVLCFRP